MKELFNGKRLFSTLLNLLGMTVAIAAFMSLMIQVRYDWTFDRSYPESERIYRLEISEDTSLKRFTAHICRPMIESFKNHIPGVEALGSFRHGGESYTAFSIQDDENTEFNFKVALCDSDMLDVFPFEFIDGNPDGFEAEGTCIISESAAGRLFGDEKAVGKILNSRDVGDNIAVSAVYRDFPCNSSVPDIVLQIGRDMIDDWSEWNTMCYFRLAEGASLQAVKTTVQNILKDNYGKDFSAEELELLEKGGRLSGIHDIYYQKDVQDSLPKGNRTTTNALFAACILILFIAVVNFINFSMASVSFFIKSMNTRRVMGASRMSLVIRQLADTFAILSISYLAAVLLVYVLSGTFVASYVSCTILPSANIPVMLAGLVAVLACTFAAGLYPALYSTSFRPALVLKGSFSLSAKGRRLRNALVCFQYVISFSFAALALYIFVQVNYMKTYDMGFRSDHILVAKTGNRIGKDTEGFKARLLQTPNITDVTFAGNSLVSSSKMGWGRNCNGNRLQFQVLPVSSNFIDFFGIKVYEGRGFRLSDNMSEGGTFIMNRKAMDEFPFLSLGTRFNGHNDKVPAEIVGVTENFNFKPMQYAVEPFALYNFGAYPWWPLYMSYIKVLPQDIPETMEYIRQAMKEFDPDIYPEDLEIQFLDESIGSLYQKEERLNMMITVAAALSFLISLVGILGLVYSETRFRKKEIALKKVYGASVKDILIMLNRHYLFTASVSFAFSVPVSCLAMKMWVRDFPYQAPVPLWIFLTVLVSMLAVTAVTVSLRSYSAAVTNPVESLKEE